MQVQTKSILGPVLTRMLVLPAVLTVASFSAASFGATSGVVKTAAIGMVTASGHFTLDRSEVWGNTTLFDGGKIETDRGVFGSGAAQRSQNSVGFRVQRERERKSSDADQRCRPGGRAGEL